MRTALAGLAATILAGALLAGSLSCGGAPTRSSPPARSRRAEPAPAETAPSGRRADVSRLERVGRYTYLYHLEWERAEDAAATLQPLLERQYGAGVVIVPQVDANVLIIRLPPRGERP